MSRAADVEDPSGADRNGGEARLVLGHDPTKVIALPRAKPTTIGRAANNLLRLASFEGVAEHHAVVRFTLSHGWLVCDWGSVEGTWLEGQRIRHCRPLSDGDEIQFGSRGPVLLFQLGSRAPVAASCPVRSAEPTTKAAGPAQSSPPPAAPLGRSSASSGQRPPAAASPGRSGPAAPLTFAGRQIPLDQIRSAHVRSRQRYPHSFSWWALLCLGGLVLLPLPVVFWPLEIGAMLGWIVLGSRKEHVLIITLRDGMAHRHSFANKITALSHRNGIRKAIGQSIESG